MNTRYVICDIEATGLHEEKEIIEIALITLQDDKVVDVYETLINPLLPISEYIQDLTSISMRELNNAPKFYDVAEAIRLRLEGAVFVSHKTDFDLNLLKKKYKEMGQDLKVKSFCTLKVAQEEIPGLKSYSLDALCSFFNIKIKDRHRATADARATLELFKELSELRLKAHPTVHYLPHHEKSFKQLTSKAGLLYFKNAQGKVIRFEASDNMEKKARALLEVKRDNRELLQTTETIDGEATGSLIIAQFRKMMFEPFRPHWMIHVESSKGENFFKIRPYKKGQQGLWYFVDYIETRKKLQRLNSELKSDSFIYREGGKSKEEILKHNHKVELLSKDAKFPTENLIIMGEGKVLGQKSLILIRDGHVVGYGYTEASQEDILLHPEIYLQRRFAGHVGADRVARRYLQELKHTRVKAESWRSLADHAKL